MLDALPEPAQGGGWEHANHRSLVIGSPLIALDHKAPRARGDIISGSSNVTARYALKSMASNHELEALVAQVAGAFLNEHDPARERRWIAERDGVRLESVFLVRKTDEIGKLRLLLVEPSARGLGIGKRLVDDCIAFAREVGYRRVTLWTNDILGAARGIYPTRGFG